MTADEFECTSDADGRSFRLVKRRGDQADRCDASAALRPPPASDLQRTRARSPIDGASSSSTATPATAVCATTSSSSTVMSGDYFVGASPAEACPTTICGRSRCWRDQRGRSVRSLPRRGLHDVRQPHHRRRAQALSARSHLDRAATAPGPGAAPRAAAGRRGARPPARPRPRRSPSWRPRSTTAIDHVLEALDAGVAHQAASLDHPQSDAERGRSRSLGDRVLGRHERGFGDVERRAGGGRPARGTCPIASVRSIRLRFYENLTQPEIAERMGVSQSYLSRIIRRTLVDLRDHISEPGLDE